MMYHLLNDFGLHKSSLKAKFAREYMDRSDLDDVRALLERRGQMYTLDEIANLASIIVTAHNLCVLETDGYSEDYSPVERYTAQQNDAKETEVLAKIDELRRKEAQQK